jgi:hypothetical protein
MKTLPHVIRQAEESDAPFILDAWRQELRHGPFARGVESRVFYPGAKRMLEGLLAKASTLLACNPEDPEQIFGCIVIDSASMLVGKPEVHWWYTKDLFQKMGIGRALYEAAGKPKLATMATKLCLPDFERDPKTGKHKRSVPGLFARYGITYNPYLLLRSELT